MGNVYPKRVQIVVVMAIQDSLSHIYGIELQSSPVEYKCRGLLVIRHRECLLDFRKTKSSYRGLHM
jgi:hypothetical protein